MVNLTQTAPTDPETPGLVMRNHGWAIAMKNAIPLVATAMANDDWIPFTYAVSTDESWAAVKAPLNSVGPTASTIAGLRVGSIDGRVLLTSF